ncbi:MAG: carbamate kinase [Pseudomonadota bacterium]
MRVVVALGGNALLKRGQQLSAENQRANVKTAAKAIAGIIEAGHEVVISHGNGPQVGLLALQNAAYKEGSSYPLDVLSAESIGMIGYLIEQELDNLLPEGKLTGTLLTQIEVDPDDPAFDKPSKPIGPVYDEAEALEIGKARGWVMGRDGNKFRRLVASPLPKRIFQIEVIRLLVAHAVTVICAGGGGIPVITQTDGSYTGIEAVIDKDRASALLADEIGAQALLMLTDVDGVYLDWGTSKQSLLKRMTPADIRKQEFASGSMGPKVEAAAAFVDGGGQLAGIGRLEDALAILEGRAGTLVAL